MARTAGMHNRGLAVSLFGAGGTLGLALGPVLVLSVIATFGLQVTPWLMIPGVVLGVLTYFIVPPLAPAHRHGKSKLFDARLVFGPVGVLSLAGTLSSIAAVTFGSAMPLWLVSARGVAPDSALLGWTLAAFSLSAALGGITAGALSSRVAPRVIVPTSMLLAMLPLYAVFSLQPGALLFFVMVMLAGLLSGASLPLLIVAAQDLAPGSMSAASGMLMGFANGAAGMLYIAVGHLQELIGLAPAMRLSYLALIPAALLAFLVLHRHDRTGVHS